MSKLNERDKSRTTGGFTASRVTKVTSPPRDQGPWFWRTRDFVASPAYRSLSVNALRCLDRLQIEHSGHGDKSNGRLIVTHTDFRTYGVTADFVRPAIDELEFKGIIQVCRGRAGDGTPHANLYRLTFTGDFEGAPATNEWIQVTEERCREWAAVRDAKNSKARERWKQAKEKRHAGKQECPRAGNPESSHNFRRVS